jgi:hypothetical protein
MIRSEIGWNSWSPMKRRMLEDFARLIELCLMPRCV